MMRKIAPMMLFIAVLVLVQNGGTAGQHGSPSILRIREQKKWQQGQADNIREVVFRVLLKETSKGSVAFIEIESHDPTEKLLSRLQRYRTDVMPVSRNDNTGRIVGQTAMEPGVVDVRPRDKKTGRK